MKNIVTYSVAGYLIVSSGLAFAKSAKPAEGVVVDTESTQQINQQAGSADINITEHNKNMQLVLKRLSKDKVVVEEEPLKQPAKKTHHKFHHLQHRKARVNKDVHHLQHPTHHRPAIHSQISLQTGWYVGGALGMSTLSATKSLSIVGTEPYTENYQLNNTNSTALISANAGYYFTNLRFWPRTITIGLQYMYSGDMTAKGIISDYGIDVYNYSYKIQQQNLLLVGQFELFSVGEFAPYAQLGIGFSQNTAKNYTENAIDPDFARDSLAYQNHTTTSFAYQAGIGVNYHFAKHWNASLGYDYLDAGTAELGKSSLFPTELPNGAKQKLISNQFKFGLTYHF